MFGCLAKGEEVLAASLSPNRSSVDSTSLRERKTTHRNGITLKTALVSGRYDKQGTTRMPLRAGLLKKQMPGVMLRIR